MNFSIEPVLSQRNASLSFHQQVMKHNVSRYSQLAYLILSSAKIKGQQLLTQIISWTLLFVDWDWHLDMKPNGD